MVGSQRFQSGRYHDAAELFAKITIDDDFVSFLTLPGYDLLS
jgi:malate synthase